MGAEQSSIRGERKVAFHVLRVEENSPAAACKLVPYFDYITFVNGIEVLQELPNVVAEMAKNHVNRPMKMAVYNSREDTTREVTIIPSRDWGGQTLLGASIRFALCSDAIDRAWHVLDVVLDSPAHKAGLVPGKDWIIGSPEIALNSQDDFYNLMIHNKKRPVRLLVFNIDQEKVREVTVVPDFDWGGPGCLGCDVGSGALHRIPKASGSAPVQVPDPSPMAVPQPLRPLPVSTAEQPCQQPPQSGSQHPPESALLAQPTSQIQPSIANQLSADGPQPTSEPPAPSPPEPTVPSTMPRAVASHLPESFFGPSDGIEESFLV